MRRFSSTFLRTLRTSAAVSLCLPLMLSPLHAIVDDAHSAALEGAMEQVEAGYKIRQEYWKGNLKAGEQKLVKHQLFKGNQVWFWLGTSTESDVTLEIDVFDAKGVKVSAEKRSGSDFAAVHVDPKKTGTYYVVFRINGKTKDEIDWALVYGWK
jgi:hypothetical protein